MIKSSKRVQRPDCISMAFLSPPVEICFLPMDPRTGVVSPEVGDGIAYLQSYTMPQSVVRWTIPESTVESLVNNCVLDADNGAQVLRKRRRTVAPEPREHYLENAMAVMQRKFEQYELEIKLWKEFSSKKGEEIIDLKKEIERLTGELRQLESMKCLQTEMWRKEAKTIALELQIQNREMEAMRRVAEHERYELVKAHKFERDALTSKLQQKEWVMKAIHKLFKAALGDTESKYNEQELPEALLWSVETYCSTVHCLMVKSANCGECALNKVLKVSGEPTSTGRKLSEKAVEQFVDEKCKNVA